MTTQPTESRISRFLRPIVLTTVVLGLAVFAFLLKASPTSASASTVTTNQTVPFFATIHFTCNLPGNLISTDITLSGPFHVLSTVTSDGAGGGHIDVTFNPQGITGTDGAGNTWQGTGVQTESTNFPSGGTFTDTFTFRFDIIGRGQTVKFWFDETAHITVNPDGTVTVAFDNGSMTTGTCRLP